jgi:protein-S-isoprenylcysteine O-methyltransferase Ste14
MSFTVYLISACLLLGAAVVIFRVLVRRGYRRTGRLTPLFSLLEWVAVLLWVGFAWANRPPDWPVQHVSEPLRAIGWSLFSAGWAGCAVAFASLGVRRSHGLRSDRLVTTAFYGATRNPQIVAFIAAMLGYVMLWPTWRTLGSFLLVGVIVHLMVMTEEEHLRDVFGSEYGQYCERVPRYVGIRRRDGDLPTRTGHRPRRRTP